MNINCPPADRTIYILNRFAYVGGGEGGVFCIVRYKMNKSEHVQ